jgi:ribonuclease HI
LHNNKIIIFTDGACSGNPGAGGWAAVILYPNDTKELSGGEKMTTNNRMELMACIQALSQVDTSLELPIQITTDSQYVKNGINTWIHNWKRNGWRTSTKEPVKNADLWQQLDNLQQQIKPTWQWVKGHAGHQYNELCDRLAVAMRDHYKML